MIYGLALTTVIESFSGRSRNACPISGHNVLFELRVLRYDGLIAYNQSYPSDTWEDIYELNARQEMSLGLAEQLGSCADADDANWSNEARAPGAEHATS